MMHIPAGLFRDLFLTDGADPFLPKPKLQQFPPALQCFSHLFSNALFKVAFPLLIIWICRRFDFRVPDNRHTSRTKQTYLFRLFIFCCNLSKEDPMVSAY